MNLKTSYSIGDRVIVAAKEVKSEVCPFCHGKGKVSTSSGIELFCQNCEDGQINYSGNRHFVEGVITGMRYAIYNEVEDEDEWAKKDEFGYHCEEYFVKVSSGYEGKETYRVDQMSYKN